MLATDIAFRGHQPVTPNEAECACELLERTPLLDFDHPSITALIAERGWRDMVCEDRLRSMQHQGDPLHGAAARGRHFLPIPWVHYP